MKGKTLNSCTNVISIKHKPSQNTEKISEAHTLFFPQAFKNKSNLMKNKFCLSVINFHK